MEIEARIVAAALDFMGMTSIEDTLASSLVGATVGATGEVQRKFLYDLVFQVVDIYVVNEKNIDVHIEELEKESRTNEGRLPDGRFGCRFSGCKMPVMVKDDFCMRKSMDCILVSNLLPTLLL